MPLEIDADGLVHALTSGYNEITWFLDLQTGEVTALFGEGWADDDVE